MKFLPTFLLFWIYYLPFSGLFAQHSTAQPYAFTHELPQAGLPIVVAPTFDKNVVLAAEQANQSKHKPSQIGYILPLRINLLSDTYLQTLPNGDKLARLMFVSAHAYALSFYLSDFKLAPHTQLSFYTPQKDAFLGVYTHKHNHPSRLFATPYLHNDTVIVEYYQPAFVKEQSSCIINELGHAYKNALYYQTSGNCNVNVNCSEGNAKTQQRDATVHVLGRQGAFQKLCTGTMVNTTNQSCTPYLLTAMHAAWDGTNLATAADFNQWVFFFNYQTPTCFNQAIQPASQSLTGAQLRAFSNDAGGDLGSDFLLLELNTRPLDSWQVYYAGWDRSTTISNTGYSIHHPSGDVKKISTYTSTPISASWGFITPNTHWEFAWVATTNGHGITEGGSSGASLFSPGGLIVGTLTGGSSSCNFRTAVDDYGKFSYHWASNGNTSLYRLKDWLDPINTNTITQIGVYSPCLSTQDNIGIISVLNPSTVTAGCRDTTQVVIMLKNFGSTTVTNASIGYRLNTNPIQTYNFVGSLLPNQTLTISLPTLSVPTNSAYTITAFSFLPNGNPDILPFNDTIRTNILYQPISASLSITNLSCFNNASGGLTISASGGQSPYLFNIGTGAQTANSFSNLNAGNFVLTITDQQACSFIQNFSISQPSAIILALSNRTNVSCFGANNGSLTVSGFNGVSPYRYNIGAGNQTTNTFPNLSPNNYIITLTDANNCTVSQSFPITQPAQLSATISSQANSTCYQSNNGVLIFSSAGGTSPYRYNIGAGNQNSNFIGGLSAGNYLVTITDANNCTITRAATITEPSQLTISQISVSNLSCFGNASGQFSISPAGGTSPYLFNISTGNQTVNSFQNLPASTPVVTITDANNCTITRTVTITEPNQLTVSQVSVSNPSCFGDANAQFSISPTGGTSPYLFNIGTGNQTTNSFQNLPASTPVVTITDANNCTITQQISISQPAILGLSLDNFTNVSCFGTCNGSLHTSGLGGQTPYSFEWSNLTYNSSLTNLCAGAYLVTLTDANNCIFKDTFNISSPPLLQTSVLNDTISCLADTLGNLQIFINGGSAPYTFLWNTSSTQQNISGLRAGIFTVTVNDALGCEHISSAQVLQTPEIDIFFSILSGTSSTLESISSTITGGTAPYTYLWSNGSTQTFATNLQNGNYVLTITDANGCIAVDTFYYYRTNVLEQAPLSNNLLIYPNPNKGRFNIRLENGLFETGELILVDMLGNKILSHFINTATDNIPIQTDNLAAGTYTLFLRTPHINLSSKLIILYD